MEYRIEHDTMGEVRVPADRYWGAQTQRSLEHFAIGDDKMPLEICRALCLIKMASARVNARMGRLPKWKAQAIESAAQEGMDGLLDGHFPLYVWQTGSGTQTNMNVNEVLSNRAIQLLGGVLGSQKPVGPNDDVNMSQSSNDTFPTAMHLAVVQLCDDRLLPEVHELAQIIERKAVKWMDVVKIGRTHLQDAVPLSVGQEWSGYAAQLRACGVAQCNLHRTIAVGAPALRPPISIACPYRWVRVTKTVAIPGADHHLRRTHRRQKILAR